MEEMIDTRFTTITATLEYFSITTTSELPLTVLYPCFPLHIYGATRNSNGDIVSLSTYIHLQTFAPTNITDLKEEIGRNFQAIDKDFHWDYIDYWVICSSNAYTLGRGLNSFIKAIDDGMVGRFGYCIGKEDFMIIYLGCIKGPSESTDVQVRAYLVNSRYPYGELRRSIEKAIKEIYNQPTQWFMERLKYTGERWIRTEKFHLHRLGSINWRYDNFPAYLLIKTPQIKNPWKEIDTIPIWLVWHPSGFASDDFLPGKEFTLSHLYIFSTSEMNIVDIGIRVYNDNH